MVLTVSNCQRAAEAKRPRLRGGSIIEPRVYLDVQGEKISSDPEKRKGKVTIDQV